MAHVSSKKKGLWSWSPPSSPNKALQRPAISWGNRWHWDGVPPWPKFYEQLEWDTSSCLYLEERKPLYNLYISTFSSPCEFSKNINHRKEWKKQRLAPLQTNCFSIPSDFLYLENFRALPKHQQPFLPTWLAVSSSEQPYQSESNSAKSSGVKLLKGSKLLKPEARRAIKDLDEWVHMSFILSINVYHRCINSTISYYIYIIYCISPQPCFSSTFSSTTCWWSGVFGRDFTKPGFVQPLRCKGVIVHVTLPETNSLLLKIGSFVANGKWLIFQASIFRDKKFVSFREGNSNEVRLGFQSHINYQIRNQTGVVNRPSSHWVSQKSKGRQVPRFPRNVWHRELWVSNKTTVFTHRRVPSTSFTPPQCHVYSKKQPAILRGY